MISLDKKKCTKCYKCYRIMKNYCIDLKNDYPVFDHSLCNLCQKCVSICPSQAILINNTAPEKIPANFSLPSSEQVLHLLEKRRSIKQFTNKALVKEKLESIISSARFAPNQNKNIDLTVITNKAILDQIDQAAFNFVKKWYKILFAFSPLTAFFKLFADDLDNIRRKMEYEIQHSRQVLKKNSQAVVVLHGPKRVPVTEKSAHYLAANMMFTAESLAVGSCLMDSLLHGINTNKALKKELKIKDDILAVLVLGHSDEEIINIPRAYKMDIQWRI